MLFIKLKTIFILEHIDVIILGNLYEVYKYLPRLRIMFKVHSKSGLREIL